MVDRLKEQRREKQEMYKEAIFKMLDKEKKVELNKCDYRVRIKILEIHGAAKARDKVTYKNQRAEIHWGLREIMGDLDLPVDRELQTQLMAIKYKINSAGQIEIIPKEEIKKKLGRSPDLAEAVIYSLASIKGTEPRIW